MGCENYLVNFRPYDETSKAVTPPKAFSKRAIRFPARRRKKRQREEHRTMVMLIDKCGANRVT
jgi:hypothetical protein